MSMHCATKESMTKEEFIKRAIAYGFYASGDDLDECDDLDGYDENGDRRRLQDIAEVVDRVGQVRIIFTIWGDCEEFVVDIVDTWCQDDREWRRLFR